MALLNSSFLYSFFLSMFYAKKEKRHTCCEGGTRDESWRASQFVPDNILISVFKEREVAPKSHLLLPEGLLNGFHFGIDLHIKECSTHERLPPRAPRRHVVRPSLHLGGRVAVRKTRMNLFTRKDKTIKSCKSLHTTQKFSIIINLYSNNDKKAFYK